MAFKINIASGKEKGKTFHLDSDSENLLGIKISEKIKGEDIDKKLEGYEFIITGASDKAGFPALIAVEGTGMKRVLLKYGKGMRERKPKGMRKRKAIRGNTISADIVQINLKTIKQGTKPLAEIFPEQVKIKEAGKQDEKQEAVEEKKD